MSITINISNIETMNPTTLNNIAGLFSVIANYAAGCNSPSPIITDEPPIPNIPPAPPAPPVIDPPLPAGIDIDSSGIPWDIRIHAASRTKNADGKWRSKRGVDEDMIKAVENELRVTMGLPPVTLVVPPPPVEISHPIFTDDEEIPALPEIAEEVVTTSALNKEMTFETLMQLITKAVTSKTLDPTTIQPALASVGLPNLPMLKNRPDLVPAVANILGVSE